MMTIHNFVGGLRGLRAMWLCEEMGLTYSVQNYGYPVPDAYRALNPLGTVPLLEDGSDVVLSESVAIMLYLAQTHGPTALLPSREPAHFARCLQWTVFGETEIGMSLNPLLAAHFMAADADKRNWSVNGLEQRLKRALNHTERSLGEDHYLVGGALTLADISVSCGIGTWQGALGGKPSPKLSDYQGRLQARPAFQRASERCKGK
ncbi:glutathione S-transferase family protein [Rhodoplanes sp. Z2-YC6860]|uniref:glutathione S-transferase family protein n=1 Tax=Rhodoplanes sp. Z2-YC6860 TaxID=674703 RepID=UPI00078DAFE7|nr:glutathione S-transferase family protein [Rhodoplanes sp. Z2-YC6860]AMN42723.1 glutathione S-transferase [Rhodoplanes sp. Z2-YC6860]